MLFFVVCLFFSKSTFSITSFRNIISVKNFLHAGLNLHGFLSSAYFFQTQFFWKILSGRPSVSKTFCMLGKFAWFFVGAYFFQNQLFWKILSGIPLASRTFCMLGKFGILHDFLSSSYYFQNQLFQKILSGIQSVSRTLCMLGKFACFFYRLLIFFKINFFQKFFQEYHKSVKQFESRAGPTFCRAWSGYKTVCKGNQQTTLEGKVKLDMYVICLFMLMLYVPVNNFSVMLDRFPSCFL